jgi:hypothetical protein
MNVPGILGNCSSHHRNDNCRIDLIYIEVHRRAGQPRQGGGTHRQPRLRRSPQRCIGQGHRGAVHGGTMKTAWARHGMTRISSRSFKKCTVRPERSEAEGSRSRSNLWFLTQFKRWGLLKEDPDYLVVAKQINRIELYRQAAAQLDMAVHVDVMCSSTLMDDTVWDGKDTKGHAAGYGGACRLKKSGPRLYAIEEPFGIMIGGGSV